MLSLTSPTSSSSNSERNGKHSGSNKRNSSPICTVLMERRGGEVREQKDWMGQIDGIEMPTKTNLNEKIV